MFLRKPTGHEYEHLCAERLRKCGFSGISVTQGSGDQGLDVLATRKGAKYGIQCKYYSGPVGNSAVQEAYAGAKYYNCDFAVVLTNSTFTKSAKELAGSTNVLLWEQDKIPYPEKSEFIVLPLEKPCNIRRFRLSNPQTVCTFPCFFPYGLKQGKDFYSPLTTLSSSRAELRFASLVEWA